MGSFSSTCCVSGLTIGAGDKVRYFLLAENPYHKGDAVCSIYGRWVPRTWPIKAKYDNYGSIEDWEVSPVQESIMKGFHKDLVETYVKETDDSYSVSTHKNMSFSQLLQNVWYATVRVDLTMKDPTLTVQPKLLIQQAMIREDVWQQLLTLKVVDDYGKPERTIDDYRRSVRKVIDDINNVSKLTEKKPMPEWLWYGASTEFSGFLITKELIPFTVGLSSHFKSLYDEDHIDDDFINLVAEFHFIFHILQQVRYVFRPSDISGPQLGEHKAHSQFLHALHKVSVAIKNKKDNGE